MNFIAKNLLEKISDLKNLIDIEGSAYNIREDGQCAGRKSTKNIKIESKEDAPGLGRPHCARYKRRKSVHSGLRDARLG